jgi:hypothetical protein
MSENAGRKMFRTLKILAMLVAGVALGLAATLATAIRGTMGGNIEDGPWQTSLYAGSSAGGPYRRALTAVHGLLALSREETIYYTALTDSDGFRILISDNAHIAEIDAARHHADCAPYKAG